MPSKVADPPIRRWTLAEYYRAGEEGYFDRRRVQLIRGEVVDMPPHGHLHYLTLYYAKQAMDELFGPGFWVRMQGPVNVADDSAPEPDIAVVRGEPPQHTDHPTTALLVIEVSHTTLARDRKLDRLYAAAGVPEYWILDVRRRQLELHRHPVADAAVPDGFRYAEKRVLDANEYIAPLALPGKGILVSSLFPPPKD